MEKQKEKAKGLLHEFKVFISRGNVIDLAVGVIIGSAFTAIVNSLVNDIVMPVIGVIIGEFLSAKAGLGYLIIYGSQIFKMNWVILSIVILCILAVLLYQIILWAARHYEKRHG